MINLYRFFITILFASLSISFANECRIERVPDWSQIIPQESFDRGFSKSYTYPHGGSGWYYVTTSLIKNDDGTYLYQGEGGYRSSPSYAGNISRLQNYPTHYSFGGKVRIIDKEICEEPEKPSKPDLGDWENCKIGKDHGFYWVTIGDGNGEGESRYKREWWSCEEPEFWEEYNHPPEDKPTEPEPTDPDNPNPTDPDNPDLKPGEGGDGDKPGEGGDNGNNGNGNNNGNDNGSTEGNGNYDKDDLTCTGSNCSGSNANKGNVPSFSDSDIYSSSNSSKTFNDVFNENFKGIDNTAIGNSLNSFIPVLPVGKCPTFYFEPLNMNIGVMNIDLFDGAGADIPCWIWDLIGTFIVIFAVMYSRTIIMGA